MKILLVRPGPHFSVQDVASGWVKGLRACGVEVADFNLDDRLGFYSEHPKIESGQHAARLAAKGIEAACYEYRPDAVVFVSAIFIPPETFQAIRGNGTPIVILHTESPYEDDRQTQRAPFADLNVVNDPTNLDQFPDGSLYLPHCYDSDVHYPRPATDEARSDFAFVGTGYPSRAEFFEQIDWTGIDVAFAGNWQHLNPESPLRPFLAHDIDECCPNDQAAVLYTSTKVSANLYRKEATATADGWAMGPREVELAAMRTFFLREPRAEGDELLPMLPTFDGPDDFSEQLRWWLAHDDARRDAARLARLAVADRTFPKIAARMLARLGV